MNLLILTPVMCMTIEVLKSLRMQVQEIEDGINHLEEYIKSDKLNNNDSLMQNAIRRELLDSIESLYEQSIIIRKNFNLIPLVKQKIEDLNKSIRNYICQRKNICDVEATELPEVLKLIKNSNSLNKQALAKNLINKKNMILINMITKAENIKNLDEKKDNYENIDTLKDLIINFGQILEKAKSYNTQDYDEMIDLLIISFQSFYENELENENEYFIQKNNYEKDKKTGEVIFKNESIENENNLLDGGENIYPETSYKDFSESKSVRIKSTPVNIEKKNDSQKNSWLKLKNEQKIISPEIKLAMELDKQNNTMSKDFPSLLSYVMSKDLLGLNNKPNLSSNLIGGSNESNFEIKELLINTNNTLINNENLLESNNNYQNMPNYISQSKLVNEGESKIKDLKRLEINKNEIKKQKGIETLIENKHKEVDKDLTIALDNIEPKFLEDQKKQIIEKNLVMDNPGIHSLKSFENNAKGDINKSIEKIDLPYPIDYDTSILAKPIDPDTNKPLADEIDFAAEILSVPLNPITKKPMRNDPEINAIVEKPPVKSIGISDQITTVDPVTGFLVKKTAVVSNAPLTETDPITLKPLPKNPDAIEAALSPIPEPPVTQQVKNELIKESLIRSNILSASGKAVPSIQSIYKKFQSSHDNQILKSKIEADLKNKFNMI